MTTTRFTRLLATLLGAVLITLGVLAAGLPALAAPADDGLQQKVDADEKFGDEQVVRSEGHIDLGPKMVDDKLVFAARDDTQAPPMWRHLRDTVIQVGDAAKTEIPEGDTYNFTGAKSGEPVWIIPQVEQAGVPWLGWNTQDPAFLDGALDNVTLRFTDAQGPGQVSLFLQNGDFGEPDVLWTGTEPGDVTVDLNTHTHANWVFTQPGVYLLDVTFASKRQDGSTSEDSQTIRVAVGGHTDPKDAAQAQPTKAAQPDDTTAADSAGSGLDPVVLIGIGIGAVALAAVVFFVIVGIVNRRRARAGSQVKNSQDKGSRE